MKWVQETLRMLQEQIGRIFTHRIPRYKFRNGVLQKTLNFIYQHRQHSSKQAGHSSPQTPTNTIRVTAKRISHSFNSNPQTPTNLSSACSFQRDPPSPLVSDYQWDSPSSLATDCQQDSPVPLVTDYSTESPSSMVTGRQQDPLPPLVTGRHRNSHSSLPPPSKSVTASLGVSEPPASDGMPSTLPLPVVTDKSATKALSSSAIKQDKLQPIASVLEQNHKLKGERNAGSLAIKLAKDALFGDEVLKLCTPMGTRSLPALPAKELQQLKTILFNQFPQYANSPTEFEELWKVCMIAVQQYSKRLRM